MTDTLESLLFSPTLVTLSDIQRLRDDNVSERDIAKLVGHEIVAFARNTVSTEVPSVGDYFARERGNVIVLWGERDAGKTTLVRSLLALPGFSLQSHPFLASSFSDRYGHTELFQSPRLQHIPGSVKDKQIETVHSIYKRSWYRHSYPISFLDVNLTSAGDQDVIDSDFNWDTLTDYLKKSTGHIHLFCLNSQAEGVTSQKALERQAALFDRVLSILSARKLLDSANALYIVVTKADTMNVPRAYLDNAAQTLVTSSLSSFWQRIRNICYSKEIYNAQPLTFSAGDFVLKDVARLDTSYARRMFHDCLLGKCMPKPTVLERCLGFTAWWLKWVFYLFMAALLVFGIVLGFEVMERSPSAVVKPFDYKSYFQTEVTHTLCGKGYEDVRIQYHLLRDDLSTECSLQTTDSLAVLPDSTGSCCDSALTRAFAPVLGNALNAFFQNSKWASQSTKRDHFLQDVRPIIDNPNLTPQQNTQFKNAQKYLRNLPQVRQFINKSKHCVNLSDINYIKNNKGTWYVYPYKNDTELRESLSQAVRKAYQSARDACCKEANRHLSTYNRTVRNINPQLSDYEKEKRKYQAAQQLANSTRSLLQRMSDIRSSLSSNEDYGCREDLRSAESKIKTIINNAKPPQRSIFQKLGYRIGNLF